jgi:bacillithiol biosynthesis cysteine-adding enzyme BshC
MEIECMDISKDDFSKKFQHREEDLMKFYQNLNFDQESIDKILERPLSPYTEQLAEIIEKDMSKYGLSESQRNNLENLKNGHRVVIAGQQAGLFMSPSYIIHKIISILVVTRDIKNKFDYDAVPVFWVAGEDHDFEEINHTFVYNKQHRRRQKISYKPNLNVPMSIGFYEYDKHAMQDTLQKVIDGCGDGEELKDLKQRISELIDRHTYWTELFHSLVHDAFKENGLLIFNAHLPEVRALEVPIFKELLSRHKDINQAFKEGQESFCKTFEVAPSIETDTNVHLFSGAQTERYLITEQDGTYQLLEKQLSEKEVLEEISTHPENFSNNVVTRPVMQEILFNTMVFLGGGAEVKYWGEIHQVFEELSVPMPIIMKRMEFVHLSRRIQKLLEEHNLDFSPELTNDVQRLKTRMVDEEMSADMNHFIDEMKTKTSTMYKELSDINEKEYMEQLIDANLEIQLKQLNYLKRRYRIEAKRQHRRHLKDLDELAELLFPDGVLQERKYHPWQYLGSFGQFPELSYQSQLVILKK